MVVLMAGHLRANAAEWISGRQGHRCPSPLAASRPQHPGCDCDSHRDSRAPRGQACGSADTRAATVRKATTGQRQGVHDVPSSKRMPRCRAATRSPRSLARVVSAWVRAGKRRQAMNVWCSCSRLQTGNQRLEGLMPVPLSRAPGPCERHCPDGRRPLAGGRSVECVIWTLL